MRGQTIQYFVPTLCWRSASLGSASRARVEWIKRRNATQFSAVSIGVVSKSTPYLAALARRRRPHHRRWRRGNHTIIIGIRRERPSSIVRPNRDRALGW